MDTIEDKIDFVVAETHSMNDVDTYGDVILPGALDHTSVVGLPVRDGNTIIGHITSHDRNNSSFTAEISRLDSRYNPLNQTFEDISVGIEQNK